MNSCVQEPRFLVPLAVPLCVCIGAPLVAGSRRMRLSWFAFNAVFAVFYGWVHQVRRCRNWSG